VENSNHLDAYNRWPSYCCREAARWPESVAAQERTDGGGRDRSGSGQQHRASAGRAQRRGKLGREGACGMLGRAEMKRTAKSVANNICCSSREARKSSAEHSE